MAEIITREELREATLLFNTCKQTVSNAYHEKWVSRIWLRHDMTVIDQPPKAYDIFHGEVTYKGHYVGRV